jgi:uncharacterized protein
VTPFVCLVELRIHYGEAHGLKEKRKHVHSLKAQLRQRFGASVAEVDDDDTWQRATLVCALVGGPEVDDRGAELQRFAESRCAGSISADRDVLTLTDIRG